MESLYDIVEQDDEVINNVVNVIDVYKNVNVSTKIEMGKYALVEVEKIKKVAQLTETMYNEKCDEIEEIKEELDEYKNKFGEINQEELEKLKNLSRSVKIYSPSELEKHNRFRKELEKRLKLSQKLYK